MHIHVYIYTLKIYIYVYIYLFFYTFCINLYNHSVVAPIRAEGVFKSQTMNFLKNFRTVQHQNQARCQGFKNFVQI